MVALRISSSHHPTSDDQESGRVEGNEEQSNKWTEERRSLELTRSGRCEDRRTDIGGQEPTQVVDDDPGKREEHDGQDEHDAGEDRELRGR